MSQRPVSLLVAAVLQGIEAAGVLTASILAGIDTGAGQSYHADSGIALTLIGAVTAAGLAVVAYGLARARRWSRTPALLTQLFAGIVGVYLVDGHRYEWGAPAIALAVAGCAALLVRPSIRALAGEPAAAADPPHDRRGAGGG